MRASTDHAGRTWLGLISTALLVDILLVRNNQRTLTRCAQDHPVATALLMTTLLAHFHNRLGKADPFTAMGNIFVRQHRLSDSAGAS